MEAIYSSYLLIKLFTTSFCSHEVTQMTHTCTYHVTIVLYMHATPAMTLEHLSMQNHSTINLDSHAQAQLMQIMIPQGPLPCPKSSSPEHRQRRVAQSYQTRDDVHIHTTPTLKQGHTHLPENGHLATHTSPLLQWEWLLNLLPWLPLQHCYQQTKKSNLAS